MYYIKVILKCEFSNTQRIYFENDRFPDKNSIAINNYKLRMIKIRILKTNGLK